MKITIEVFSSGVVVHEADVEPKIYDARTERLLEMLEDLGRKIIGKRIKVEEN